MEGLSSKGKIFLPSISLLHIDAGSLVVVQGPVFGTTAGIFTAMSVTPATAATSMLFTKKKKRGKKHLILDQNKKIRLTSHIVVSSGACQLLADQRLGIN